MPITRWYTVVMCGKDDQYWYTVLLGKCKPEFVGAKMQVKQVEAATPSDAIRKVT